jgi:hypothetical protein
VSKTTVLEHEHEFMLGPVHRPTASSLSWRSPTESPGPVRTARPTSSARPGPSSSADAERRCQRGGRCEASSVVGIGN